MSTISVPIDSVLESFIEEMLRDHRAANKADVVRRALYELQEQEILGKFYKSKQELAAGKIIFGDLKTVVSKLK